MRKNRQGTVPRAARIRWPRRFLPIGALLLATACAGSRGASENPFTAALAEANEIEILVRNLNFNQVTIYTARSGGPVRRLGTVAGKGEATFRTEWHLPEIQLRVRHLAGADYFTETLPVSPGELLELIVPGR